MRANRRDKISNSRPWPMHNHSPSAFSAVESMRCRAHFFFYSANIDSKLSFKIDDNRNRWSAGANLLDFCTNQLMSGFEYGLRSISNILFNIAPRKKRGFDAAGGGGHNYRVGKQLHMKSRLDIKSLESAMKCAECSVKLRLTCMNIKLAQNSVCCFFWLCLLCFLN